MKDEIFVHDVKTFSLTSDKVREIFEWFKLALNLWIDRPCVKYDQRANSKRSIFLKIHVMRDSSNSKTIWMDWWWTKSIRIDFISCLLLLIHACTDNMLHSGDMNWKKCTFWNFILENDLYIVFYHGEYLYFKDDIP